MVALSLSLGILTVSIVSLGVLIVGARGALAADSNPQSGKNHGRSIAPAAEAAGAGGDGKSRLIQQQEQQREPKQQQRRLAVVVKRMSEESGATIECDSSIASVLVTAPQETTTAENFEKQIDALVTRLPKGMTWAKLYMPALPTASTVAPKGVATATMYDPDALVGYAFAASDLFGKQIGAALPPGTIEVLGRKLDADKAAAVAAALGLKAVYVIVGSVARRNSVDGHVQAILAMSPANRSAVIAQISLASQSSPGSWGVGSLTDGLVLEFIKARDAQESASLLQYVRVVAGDSADQVPAPEPDTP